MSGPAGAGAGAPNTYRPPTLQELKEIGKMFREPTAKDTDRILAWLRAHPDLSVDWFYDTRKNKRLRWDDIRGDFETPSASVIGLAFMTATIPADHALIDELLCRSTRNFTTKGGDGTSILGDLKFIVDEYSRGGERDPYEEDYRKKYALIKNPAAQADRCKRAFMRQGVKDVANLQKTSKARLPLPEGPMSIVTGMLTGKSGDTAAQMATAKKELGKGGRRKTRRRKTRRTRRR